MLARRQVDGDDAEVVRIRFDGNRQLRSPPFSTGSPKSTPPRGSATAVPCVGGQVATVVHLPAAYFKRTVAHDCGAISIDRVDSICFMPNKPVDQEPALEPVVSPTKAGSAIVASPLNLHSKTNSRLSRFVSFFEPGV